MFKIIFKISHWKLTFFLIKWLLIKPFKNIPKSFTKTYIFIGIHIYIYIKYAYICRYVCMYVPARILSPLNKSVKKWRNKCHISETNSFTTYIGKTLYLTLIKLYFFRCLNDKLIALRWEVTRYLHFKLLLRYFADQSPVQTRADACWNRYIFSKTFPRIGIMHWT